MTVIRNMKPEDVAEVAEMESQIFSMPWSAQGFLDALKLSNTIFMVAEEDGEIAGYIGMYISLDEGEITNVAVRMDMRCRGIGEQLVCVMKEEAGRRKVNTIVLEVRVSNAPAIHLYEKNGFVNRGVRKGFYELPKEDAYIMVYGQ